MRGDWDPNHRKRADVQKRYPDITAIEWEFLLGLLGMARDRAVIKGDHESPKYMDRLVRKIEQRIGERT